jgi:hypothetical protein
MTALTEIQQKWANNTVQGFITGILLSELSVAFNTLDTNTLCSKLAIYGFDFLSCNWFRPFLTGRMQRVKIGIHYQTANDMNQESPKGDSLPNHLCSVRSRH